MVLAYCLIFRVADFVFVTHPNVVGAMAMVYWPRGAGWLGRKASRPMRAATWPPKLLFWHDLGGERLPSVAPAPAAAITPAAITSTPAIAAAGVAAGAVVAATVVLAVATVAPAAVTAPVIAIVGRAAGV